jgi:hypothetical protein
MQGMMIGGCDSVAQRRSRALGVDSRFRRNALLANTALILLCYIWRVLVIPSPCCKLFSGQTHNHILPELVLTLCLTLPETNKCPAAKNQFREIKRNIKPMCQG